MHAISNQFNTLPGTKRVPGLRVTSKLVSRDNHIEKRNARVSYSYFRKEYLRFLSNTSTEVEKRRDMVATHIRLNLSRHSIQIPVRNFLNDCACSGKIVHTLLRIGNSNIKLSIPEDAIPVLESIKRRIELFCQLSVYQKLHQKPYLKDIQDLVLKLESVGVSTHEQMQLYRGIIDKHTSPTPQIEKPLRMNSENPYKSMYSALIQ